MRCLLFLVCLFAVSHSVFADAEKDPDCPWAGIKPTKEQLDKILADHQQWLADNKGKFSEIGTRFHLGPLYANLCRANLTKARLAGANLTFANFFKADLTNARLVEANLTDADFVSANLTSTNLSHANLSKASLISTDLTNTNLYKTDLTNTFWSPENKSFPKLLSLVENQTLDKIRFKDTSHLVDLRKALYEAGYITEGKRITKALKRGENLKRLEDHDFFSILEGLFNKVFFDLPTDWGVEPGRALKILLIGIVFFMFFYILAVFNENTVIGIWRIRPDKKDRLSETTQPDRELVKTKNLLRAMQTAAYFSLLTAFHIGWRELNVGSWINRLQMSEYTYRATGWVRTVAGIQSLLSVYLVAMWALTYFGRPFD